MAYFANGSEGEVLECQCADCPLGNGSCPVMGIQLTYNYDQLNKGQEKLREAMTMLVDDEGTCEVRKQILENVTRVSGTSPTIPTLAEWLEGWEANVEAGQSTISRDEAERRYYEKYPRNNGPY